MSPLPDVDRSRGIARAAFEAGDLDGEIEARLAAFLESQKAGPARLEELERAAQLVCAIGEELDDPGNDDEWRRATRHAERRRGIVEGAVLELARASQPERAFAITQRAKAPVLVRRLRLTTMRRGDLSPSASRYRDLSLALDRARAELRKARRSNRADPRLQQQADEISGQLEKARQRLRTEDPEALAGFAAPLELDDLLPIFPADGRLCLIDLFMTSEAAVVLLLRRAGSTVQATAAISSGLSLNEYVGAAAEYLSSTLEPDLARRLDGLKRLSRFLHDRLMCGLAQTVRERGHGTLVVVPHITHAIPFHLSYVCETNSFLGETFAVSYSPCVQLALATALRPRPVDFFVAGTLPVLLAADALGDLPAARAEQDAVANAVANHTWPAPHPAVVTLRGSETTKSALQKNMREAGLSVVASHARFSARDPHGSGLVLDGSAEGLWTIDEIYEMPRLPHAPMIILSSCVSGMSNPGDDAEIVALPPAFISIGAAAVLGTLWPVEDLSTSFLVERFVWHLMDPGETPSTALGVACLDVQKVTRDEAIARCDSILLDVEERGPGFLESETAIRVAQLRKRIQTGPEYPFASPLFWGAFFVSGCGWQGLGGKAVIRRRPPIEMAVSISAVHAAAQLFGELKYDDAVNALDGAVPALEGRYLGRALLLRGDALFRRSASVGTSSSAAADRKTALRELKRALPILEAQGDLAETTYCSELIRSIADLSGPPLPVFQERPKRRRG